MNFPTKNRRVTHVLPYALYILIFHFISTSKLWIINSKLEFDGYLRLLFKTRAKLVQNFSLNQSTKQCYAQFLFRLLRQYIKHVSVDGPFSWNKNGFPFFKTNFLQNKCSKLFTGIKSRLLRQYINTCFDLWSLFHEIKIAFHSLKLTFSKINILNFLLEFNQDYWDNISIHVSVYGTLFMK